MILNRHLPYDPFAGPRLPGVAPLDPADWLIVDDAFAAQMAERARLLRDRRADVSFLHDSARAAGEELLDTVLSLLPAGYKRDGARVVRPDGVRLLPDRDDPLVAAALLVQEDLCLMMRRDDEPEHVLRGAVLCFPASWRLSEKANRPLIGIHDPVPEYGPDLARRVQRLFDGVRANRPLWRFNALWYDDPTLFQPRSAVSPRPPADPGSAGFFRSERQSVLRLPRTGAVVFSIHTFVLARADALVLRAASGQQA